MMLITRPSLTAVVNDIIFFVGLKSIIAVIRGSRPNIKKPLTFVWRKKGSLVSESLINPVYCTESPKTW